MLKSAETVAITFEYKDDESTSQLLRLFVIAFYVVSLNAEEAINVVLQSSNSTASATEAIVNLLDWNHVSSNIIII